MNQKRWIISAVVALAAASAAFCIFGLSKPEPLYQGRPVSFWIEQMSVRRGQGFVPPSEEAWKAFSRMDPDALQFLIATLRAREPLREVLVARLRQVLPRKIAARLPLQDYPIEWVKLSALSAIGRMGPNAREAVPALIRMLTDNQTRIRYAAADALGKVGPDARNALPALIRSVKDADAQVRLAAIESLYRIAPDDERFVSSLSSLADPHKEMRFRATELLLDKKRNSAALYGTLTGLLRESDTHDRWRAVELLRKTRQEVAVVVPALIERLKDENNRVRGLAAIALGEIGPAAQQAVPAMRKALNDDYSNVRDAAAEALDRIAPAETQ